MTAGIVIIGAGLAAYQTATAIRTEDKDIKLSIVTRDSGDFYSKPILSNAFARNKHPDQIASQTAQQMAERLNADIKTQCVIDEIDAKNKIIRNKDFDLAYEKLILATGAHVNQLPMDKTSLTNVISINHLDHYKQFRLALEGKKHIVIIGSGFIGCELANDLASSAYTVTVISAEEYPLQRLVPQQIGKLLKQRLSALSISWHFEQFVSVCKKTKDGFEVETQSGKHFHADLVLSAIGIQPDLQLAKTAALKTNVGIVVDNFLQTSENNIYAIGDCAEFDGRVRAFVSPIQHASKVLAKTVTGNKTKLQFPALPMNIKTLCYPILIFNDYNVEQLTWKIDINENGANALGYQQDKLVSFILCGTDVKKRAEFLARLQ